MSVREQSTMGDEGVGNGCSKLGGVGVIGCGGWPGGRGLAQLISAVTDMVGLSFFATLDMATHKHPHITSNPLHFSNVRNITAQIQDIHGPLSLQCGGHDQFTPRKITPRIIVVTLGF